SFSKLNRRAEAATYFQRAVKLKPDYWEAIYSLGEELAFAGKDTEARPCFQEVLRLKPNYPMAHLNLGVSLAKAGRWDEAAFQFEEVLRLEPGNRQARQYLEKAKRSKPGEKSGGG